MFGHLSCIFLVKQSSVDARTPSRKLERTGKGIGGSGGYKSNTQYISCQTEY
jgi:hypothetical protein